MSATGVVLVARRNRPAVEGVFDEVVRTIRTAGVDIVRLRELTSVPGPEHVAIAHQPVGPLAGLGSARVLGQRVLDRADRLVLVEQLGIPVPPWARAYDPDAVADLARRSDGPLLHKADRSYKGQHVHLLAAGEGPVKPEPGDVVMTVLEEDPITYKAHVFGRTMISSHAYHSPPATQLPFAGGVYEYELFEPDAELERIVTEIGPALLEHGGGYCAVDLMRQAGRWWVIEVNTGAVGLASTWGRWPDRYARAYAAALTTWLAAGAPAPTVYEAHRRARALRAA